MVTVSDVQRLAEWWTQATKENRWLLLRQVIEGPPSREIPQLRTLHIAIYLSEAASGEIERSQA
jgi:hypothetical protein